MPGKLKDDAKCPVCDKPIFMIMRATACEGGCLRPVKLGFYHEDPAVKDHVISGTMDDMDLLHGRLHETPEG